MSLYICSLTSKEEIELNNIVRYRTDVKFPRRAQVILASNARHQLNKLLKFWDIPIFKLGELFTLLTKALMVLDLSIKGSRPLTFNEEQCKACKFQPKSTPYFTPKVHHYL